MTDSTDAQVLAALEVLGWPDDREASAHIEPDGYEVTPARHYWDTVTAVLTAAEAARFPLVSLLPEGMTEAELIERFRVALEQPQRISVLPPGESERAADACPACAVQPYDPDLGEHHAHLTAYGYAVHDPGHGQDLAGGLIAEGRRQAVTALARQLGHDVVTDVAAEDLEPWFRAALHTANEQGRRQATEGWGREWGVELHALIGDETGVHLCEDEALAHHIALREPTSRVVSRLVGPWEPAEQAKPTCTCPLLDVTAISEDPSVRKVVQGYDHACPACPAPSWATAEQDGDGR